MLRKVLKLSGSQVPQLQNGENSFILSFIQHIYGELTKYNSLYGWSSEFVGDTQEKGKL